MIDKYAVVNIFPYYKTYGKQSVSSILSRSHGNVYLYIYSQSVDVHYKYSRIV